MPKLNRGDLHATYKWRNVISPLVRNLNPLCQWVSPDTGLQCTHASEICHHLIDPKVDPTIFFSWSNIVALCTEHHAGGRVGETMGKLFCHTIGPAGAIYPQSARLLPCWHDDFKPRPNPQTEPTGFLPPGAVASSVGDELLDRALAEPL